MSVLDTLLVQLRRGSLKRDRLLLETRFALSRIRPTDTLPLSKDEFMEAATSAAEMSVRYRDLASALAIVLEESHDVSERELAAALGWNRTTLRKRIRDGKTRALANDITTVLLAEHVL